MEPSKVALSVGAKWDAVVDIIVEVIVVNEDDDADDESKSWGARW